MVLTLSEFNEIFANKDVNDSYVIGKCLELRKKKKSPLNLFLRTV